MPPVSHTLCFTATPDAATPVEFETLKMQLADAILLALNTDHWEPYKAAEAAWFFAISYQPHVLHQGVQDC